MTKLCKDCKFIAPLARCLANTIAIPDLVNGGTKRTGPIKRCNDQRESKYMSDCGSSGRFWMPK